MVTKRLVARLTVTTLATIGWLVPSLSSPARTVYLPVTLARSATLSTLDPATRFSFLPTHIAFSWVGQEGTGVHYRTTSRSGDVSRWMRARESHDAERGARHFSAVLSVARPAAIEYEPITPSGKTMGPVTLDYLNTIDGPRRAFRIPLVANAAAETPPIVTRAEWGADESLKSTGGGCKRRFFNVQQLFVHHTAGNNNDRNPAATMRAIYWYHTQRQGWCDIGYNFVIGPDGTIFEGRWARKYASWEVHSTENLRERAVVGAHVSGFNSGSVGISLMGHYGRIKPPPLAQQWLTELLAWEADRHDLDPLGSHTYRNPDTGRTRKLPFIAGHRDAGSTACPGGFLYRALPSIREDTATVMGAGKASTTLEMGASSTQVAPGETVDLAGRLTDPAGGGIFNAPVTLYQRRPRGEWTVAAESTTGLDGSFRFTIAPAATIVTRAVYFGDPTSWGSQSSNVKIRVTAAATPSP
jgi:hypothetical protein